jgi:hypothetical protein
MITSAASTVASTIVATLPLDIRGIVDDFVALVRALRILDSRANTSRPRVGVASGFAILDLLWSKVGSIYWLKQQSERGARLEAT